ncbi:hypothetical protein E4U53_004092 [Claviceps sorghi]|nr:hypothetical protein E4U53_004092 [Claviceps sorghi]
MRFSTSAVLAVAAVYAGQASAGVCKDHTLDNQSGPLADCPSNGRGVYTCGKYGARLVRTGDLGQNDFYSGRYPITIRINCKGDRETPSHTNGLFRYCSANMKTGITVFCPGTTEYTVQYFVDLPPNAPTKE